MYVASIPIAPEPSTRARCELPRLPAADRARRAGAPRSQIDAGSDEHAEPAERARHADELLRRLADQLRANPCRRVIPRSM